MRLLEQVQLLEPAGEEVDLERDTFRWSALPGATSYEVQLYRLDDHGGGVYWKPARKYRAATSSARLGSLDSKEGADAAPLDGGARMGWEVWAFDAAGRSVGKSLRSKPLRLGAR